MSTNELIQFLLSQEILKDDYFYDGSIYYYLACVFPDLPVKQCTEAVQAIREKLDPDYSRIEVLELEEVPKYVG